MSWESIHTVSRGLNQLRWFAEGRKKHQLRPTCSLATAATVTIALCCAVSPPPEMTPASPSASADGEKRTRVRPAPTAVTRPDDGSTVTTEVSSAAQLPPARTRPCEYKHTGYVRQPLGPPQACGECSSRVSITAVRPAIVLAAHQHSERVICVCGNSGGGPRVSQHCRSSSGRSSGCRMATLSWPVAGWALGLDHGVSARSRRPLNVFPPA
jgi:hypothetical protein